MTENFNLKGSSCFHNGFCTGYDFIGARIYSWLSAHYKKLNWRVGVWPILVGPGPAHCPFGQSIIYTYNGNRSKNEQFLSRSFEMAHICILLTIFKLSGKVLLEW